MDRPFRIGLTGGLASGKSTVADFFAAHEVPVIDTDVIARQLVQPSEPALDEIRAAFGDDVLDEHRGLDRAFMRKMVFSDSAKREQLESILHPRIRDEAIRQSISADGRYQIIVVPLLVGSPMRQFMDRILVVDCQEDTQLGRLLARDAEDEDQARRMLSAQAGRQDRLAIADDVISNDADLGDTRRQVSELHGKYLTLANAVD